jgi:uncharacterized protein with FMN-binding domain
MKRALPTIALSAAGLTWLLHAQGVIDTKATSRSTVASPSTTTPPAAAPPAPDPNADTPSTEVPRTAPPTTRPSSSGNRTVDGPVVDTRFGPVEVEIVLAGNRITDVKALEYPNEARRSQFISSQALPLLHDEAVSAQSANIDTISGATYTSDAYAQSLQAALDRAGITTQ